MARVPVSDFGVIQKNFAGATVTFFVANDDGTNTGVLATLYEAAEGDAPRSNPQVLDENGQLAVQCFVESAIMAEISNISATAERSVKKIRKNPMDYALPSTSAAFNASEVADDVDAAAASAQASADSAANSQQSAENSAASAVTAGEFRDQAGGFATNASNSADAAAASETVATTKAGEAATSATNAAESEEKAELWANAPENTPVEPGKFSSYHWAKKSEQFSQTSASLISFNNVASGAASTNVQGAIDELYAGDQAVIAANSTAAYAINLASGKNDNFLLTLTANCAITITNPTARLNGFILMVKQDATGSRTITWPASVKWPGGVAPTLTGAANSTDTLVFMSPDGGTTWQGFVAGADVK